MKITIFLLSVLFFAGCGSKSTGVLPKGNNEYVIMETGHSGFASPSEITSNVSNEATRYCNGMNQKINIVDINSFSGFGQFPKAEIKFKCVD